MRLKETMSAAQKPTIKAASALHQTRTCKPADHCVKRGWRLVSILMGATALSACGAEPLSTESQNRLQQVFAEMDERRAIGVVQNLRFAGLYKGALTNHWQPELGEAINEAHYALGADGDYDLNTSAGASGFLRALSSYSSREDLVSGVSNTLPEFTQVRAVQTTTRFENGACLLDGGTYERNGERIEVTFSYSRDDGAIQSIWDGWPGGNTLLLLSIRTWYDRYVQPGEEP